MSTLPDLARTTTVRWTLGIALALILQSAMLSGIFYWSTVRHATDEVDGKLVAVCRALRTRDRAAIVEAIDNIAGEDVHRVTLVGLFDASGAVIAGNMAALPARLARADGPLVADLVRTLPPDPVPNSSRAVACATSGGDRLVVAKDLDELDAIRALIGRALAVVTLPAIAIAALFGVVLGLRGQGRFRLVQGVIDDVAGGNLGRRLPTRSSFDPFDRLGQAVNGMLDRLEIALDEVRAFGDDIAHELRTPLTRLRARLERGCHDATSLEAFRAIGERAIEDIDHALSIVSAILRIRAIGGAKRGSEFKPVDLRTLIADAADLYKPIADDRGIDLVVEPGPAATIIADGDLLMEALCNLIDNAMKFTPPGGRVRCSTTVRDGRPIMRVADTGPGIPRDQREVVLRRFHRGADHVATDGHGIGLSLVAAIVRLHRFDLEIGDAHPGCEMIIACTKRTQPDDLHGVRALEPANVARRESAPLS